MTVESLPGPGDGLGLRAEVSVDANGQARVEGGARIQDGTSSTVLVAEQPAQASCADVDQDGLAGLTMLTHALRDVRSGELFTATVLPTDGEADTPGRHPATVTLTGGGRTLTAAGMLVIQQLFRQNGPAGNGVTLEEVPSSASLHA